MFLKGRPRGVIAKWVGAGEVHSALFTDGRYSHEVFPRLPRHFSTGFHPIADKT